MAATEDVLALTARIAELEAMVQASELASAASLAAAGADDAASAAEASTAPADAAAAAAPPEEFEVEAFEDTRTPEEQVAAVLHRNEVALADFFTRMGRRAHAAETNESMERLYQRAVARKPRPDAKAGPRTRTAAIVPNLVRAFQKWDANDDGFLSPAQAAAALSECAGAATAGDAGSAPGLADRRREAAARIGARRLDRSGQACPSKHQYLPPPGPRERRGLELEWDHKRCAMMVLTRDAYGKVAQRETQADHRSRTAAAKREAAARNRAPLSMGKLDAQHVTYATPPERINGLFPPPPPPPPDPAAALEDGTDVAGAVEKAVLEARGSGRTPAKCPEKCYAASLDANASLAGHQCAEHRASTAKDVVRVSLSEFLRVYRMVSSGALEHAGQKRLTAAWRNDKERRAELRSATAAWKDTVKARTKPRPWLRGAGGSKTE